MVHPNKPPLPPNKHYHRPLNYHGYVKDSNSDAHVGVFKIAIKTNIETNDVEIINILNFTLGDTMFD
jgi:hypothetical protein